MPAKKKAKPKKVVKKKAAKKTSKSKKKVSKEKPSPLVKKENKPLKKLPDVKLSPIEQKLLGLANENKHVLLYGKDPANRTILISEVHIVRRSEGKYKYVDSKRADGKVILKKLTGDAGITQVLEQDGTFFVDNLKCNDEDTGCYEELACMIENLKDRGITGAREVWSVGIGGWLVVYARNYKDFPEYFLEQFELVSLDKEEEVKSQNEEVTHKKENNKTEAIDYDWSIKDTREVFCNGQHIAKLPNLKFKLFKRLYEKSGKYVKNKTLKKCWSDELPKYKATLPTTMSKLNAELEKGLKKNHIEIKSRVIEPKQENKKNVSYKLVT